jgi:hypothetical protein
MKMSTPNYLTLVIYTFVFVFVIFMIYWSAKSSKTDPEGMIIQSMLFPMACIVWSLLIARFVVGCSWINTFVISLVTSFVIFVIWNHVKTNQKESNAVLNFITNLITFPFWFPLIFGKTQLSETYLSFLGYMSMPMFKLFNSALSIIDPKQIRMFE